MASLMEHLMEMGMLCSPPPWSVFLVNSLFIIIYSYSLSSRAKTPPLGQPLSIPGSTILCGRAKTSEVDATSTWLSKHIYKNAKTAKQICFLDSNSYRTQVRSSSTLVSQKLTKLLITILYRCDSG